jgi:hypothetical protein
MRRTIGLALAGGALALAVPAAIVGATGTVARVRFPTLVTQQVQAASGLCKDGGWQVVGKAHGDPFKDETQCVKYAASSPAFGFPAYSFHHDWTLLTSPFGPKVPQNTCTNASKAACLVLYKGLEVPLGGKTHDYGMPEDPPDDRPVFVSTTGMMLQGRTDSVDAHGCASTPGTFSFAASGRSLGPYPGTFTETGSVTVRGGSLDRRRSSADFTIVLDVHSDVGDVHMTYAHPPPPPSISGSADCFQLLSARLVHFSMFIGYHATITRPDGTTFEDSGDSIQTMTYATNGITTLASSFEGDAQSNLLPSNASLPPPTPVCPPEGCS